MKSHFAPAALAPDDPESRAACDATHRVQAVHQPVETVHEPQGERLRFGGFFDSVLDRFSDMGLLVGLLVWYGSINRQGYVVLTAICMMGCVMVSYTRARAENSIPM